MTSYTLRKGAAEKSRADVVVIGVVRTPKGLQAAPGGEGVAAAYGRKLVPLLSTIGFSGRLDEVTRIPTAGTIRSPLLLVVGMGELRDLDATAVRRAAGVALRSIPNAASVALALPALDDEQVRAVVEGALLGGYSYTAYKTGAASTGPAEVVVLTDTARTKESQRALEVARVVGDATRLARDWVNTPAADLTPASFADAVVAEHRARKPGRVKVTVTDEAQLRSRAFGGIVGVGRASSHPPRLVQLAYTPRGAAVHVALVGKGITFDSGGLSIKPSAGMTTMKCDMAGAAAVLAATFAIAELGLPVQVTALAPMAENMVSGDATRPGDVLTMYGGATVEVLNTDAEGRLVLADALVLARESTPDVVVDVATLTGACITALGDRVAGVLGNDDDLVARVVAAGDRAGEALWPLPITPEMSDKVRTSSSVADLMQHNVDLYGGAIYAAAFLQEFVADRRWAHLDIAGPAFNTRSPYGHVPSGGTGFSVATLVQLVTDLAAGGQQAPSSAAPTAT
ncbi:MAG TPA: leucyl aminopeptidase [Nocardioidaceae bacterium]|nr:leucyl aminopeptidase [Nocardioidaceae bacterium]